MLKPPTPEQAETYDVCEEDGDLFHVTDTVHMQCQRIGGDLYIHDISVGKDARGAGVGRSVITQLRNEYPGLRIVANGVDWLEPAGRFWNAMAKEGLVDVVVTYEHGDIAAADIGSDGPRP